MTYIEQMFLWFGFILGIATCGGLAAIQDWICSDRHDFYKQ